MAEALARKPLHDIARGPGDKSAATRSGAQRAL